MNAEGEKARPGNTFSPGLKEGSGGERGLENEESGAVRGPSEATFGEGERPKI